jgi:hypothetical protein
MMQRKGADHGRSQLAMPISLEPSATLTIGVTHPVIPFTLGSLDTSLIA